jgi:hypothetical protein
MVVSLIALFVAVGGVGYAASAAKKNSVTSKSIRNGAIVGKDVKDDRLTGADILESSLEGIAGTQGPQGPAGTAGAAGPDFTGDYGDLEIAAGAVSGGTGGDIVDGSISGADVDESSLQGLVGAVDGAGDTRVFSSGRVAAEAPDAGGSAINLNLINTGEFSILGICNSAPGPDGTSEAIVGLIPVEEGSAFNEIGNDGADPAITRHGGIASTSASEPLTDGEMTSDVQVNWSQFSAIAPSGATLTGTVLTATNASADDCAYSVIATERGG